MAGKSSIWVQIRVVPESGEADRVRADRILEVGTHTPGEVELRISGWKEPAVVPLSPGSMEQTAAWATELLEAIEATRRRKEGTLLVFVPAQGGYRAYWSVLTLPGMRPVNRPVLDRTLLAPFPEPDGAGAGDMEQRLARLEYDRSARQQGLGLPPVA